MALTSPARAQCGETWLIDRDAGILGIQGRVNAATLWDPDGAGPLPTRLAVGGDFTIAGNTLAKNVAWYDFGTKKWHAFGTGMTVPVQTLLARASGELLAGVEASILTGDRGLFQWNGSAWVNFAQARALGTVRAIVEAENGDLYAGGGPLWVWPNSTVKFSVLKWNGTVWSGVATVGGNPSPIINDLALTEDGNLVVAGSFATAGATTSSCVALWNSQNGWSALGSGLTSVSGQPVARDVQLMPGGRIVVAGSFTHAGGAAAQNLAEWDGTNWLPLGGGIGGTVQSVTRLVDGRLMAAGSFSVPSGSIGTNVAVWTGTNWTPISTDPGFQKPFYGTVNRILGLDDGDFLVCGEFTRIGKQVLMGVARRTATEWQTLSSGSDGYIWDLTVAPNGELLASGLFTELEGTRVIPMARWNPNGWAQDYSQFQRFSPDLIAPAVMRYLRNGDLIVSGGFQSVGNVSASYIARWDGVAWHPLGLGLGDIASDILEMPNGDLIVSGAFRTAGGSSIGFGVARWNGVNWSSLAGGMDQSTASPAVYSLALMPNGDVIAAGSFTKAGGVSANNIARWNGSTWSPLGDVQGGPIISVATFPNGDVVASGQYAYFRTASGTLASSIARWNGSGWFVLTKSVIGDIRKLLVLPSGELIVGAWGNIIVGSSFSGTSVTYHGVARWNGTAWREMDGGVGDAGSRVFDLALLPSGEIAVAGEFYTVGSGVSPYFARWSQDGETRITASPVPKYRAPGQKVSLTARCASGYPNVIMKWLKNSTEVQPSARVEIVSNGDVSTITIHDVQFTDAGNYVMQACAQCGCVVSQGATLTVKSCLADFNSDGMVTDLDFIHFVTGYNTVDCASPQMPSGCPADFTADGFVDDADFVVFAMAYNEVQCP